MPFKKEVLYLIMEHVILKVKTEYKASPPDNLESSMIKMLIYVSEAEKYGDSIFCS